MHDTKYLVSVDPGKRSAAAVFRYSDTEPASLSNVFQVDGGVDGFLSLLGILVEVHGFEPCHCCCTWISEKFTPRNQSVAGFAQSLDSTLPLVCEGVMIGRELMPVYQQGGKNPEWVAPQLMYWAGGKSAAERKKRLHRWLKDSKEFYVTGKQFGHGDADDVRAAIGHGIGWFRRQKHMPTLLRYFRGNEETPEE